jgi:hypothetical protein
MLILLSHIMLILLSHYNANPIIAYNANPIIASIMLIPSNHSQTTSRGDGNENIRRHVAREFTTLIRLESWTGGTWIQMSGILTLWTRWSELDPATAVCMSGGAAAAILTSALLRSSRTAAKPYNHSEALLSYSIDCIYSSEQFLRSLYSVILMICYGSALVIFILTSVVGTNSDPSEEIHLWIIISFSFCLPRLPQVPLVARPVK